MTADLEPRWEPIGHDIDVMRTASQVQVFDLSCDAQQILGAEWTNAQIIELIAQSRAMYRRGITAGHQMAFGQLRRLIGVDGGEDLS